MPCTNCGDFIDIVIYTDIKCSHDGIINIIAPHHALGHASYCPNCGKDTEISCGYHVKYLSGCGYRPDKDGALQLIRTVDKKSQPYFPTWKGLLKSNKTAKWPWFEPKGFTDHPADIKKAFGINE